jgi:hypothetical protein
VAELAAAVSRFIRGDPAVLVIVRIARPQQGRGLPFGVHTVYNRRMSGPGEELSRRELSREDLSATLAARKELGPEFEPALVESLAERLEGVIEARVEARLAQRPPAPSAPPVPAAQPMSPNMRVGLALGSMGIAIPCTAIAASLVGLPGLIVVWSGVVLVNVAAALGSRGGR